MSLFAKTLLPEKRETFKSSDPGNLWARLFGETGQDNASGIRVSPDVAWKWPIFYGCVSLISRGVGQLPLSLFRRQADDGRQKAIGHHVHHLIHTRPNPEQTSYIWREAMQAWVLTYGNAYSEIQRDGAGRPVALWPMEPTTIDVERDRDTNQIIYIQNRGKTNEKIIPFMNVLHIRTLGNGLVGKSPVQLFAQGIGLGLAAETAGAALLKNGWKTGGVLMHPGVLGADAKQNLKKSMDAEHVGSENTGKSMVLEEGMKWVQNTIPPDDAQYIETRVRQLRDFALIFHIPPHKLADLADATFSNVEEQNIEWLTDTLGPWIVNWEQELDFKLLTAPQNRTTFFTKFNTNALLRGNVAARSAFYVAMWNIGKYSINDILRLEDENPIGPDGDVRMVPANMVPLKTAINPPKPVPVTAKGPGTPAKGSPPEDNSEHVIAAHRGLLCDVAGRIVRGEVGAIDKAMRKAGDMTDAVVGVLDGAHERRLHDMLAPAVSAAHAASGKGPNAEGVSFYVRAIVSEHIESLLQLATGPNGPTALLAWRDSAPDALADRIIKDMGENNV